MGIERKVTSIGHGRLFLALLASLILVLSSCVAPSDESSSPETVDTEETEVQTLEEPGANSLYERCKEIVAVGAYAFGIGTVNSAAPFGGGGRVRWKVDDNRYERDADLDTAGEGVFCFRFIQRSNQSFIPLTGVHASCPREIVEEEKCDLQVFPAMGEEFVVNSVSPRGRPRAGSGEHYI